MKRRTVIVVLVLVLCSAMLGWSQYRRSRRWRSNGEGNVHYTEGGVTVDEETMQTAREVASHSTEVPMWTNTTGFERDAFTFCRIVFKSGNKGGSRGTWVTDFPD